MTKSDKTNLYGNMYGNVLKGAGRDANAARINFEE